MIVKIKEGDKVLNTRTNKIGTVQTVYPDVDISIVKYDTGIEKNRLDELAICGLDIGTVEKKSIGSKIRDKFVRRSYD